MGRASGMRIQGGDAQGKEEKEGKAWGGTALPHVTWHVQVACTAKRETRRQRREGGEGVGRRMNVTWDATRTEHAKHSPDSYVWAHYPSLLDTMTFLARMRLQPSQNIIYKPDRKGRCA